MAADSYIPGIAEAAKLLGLTTRNKGAFASRKWGNEMVGAIQSLQTVSVGELPDGSEVSLTVTVHITGAATGDGQYIGYYWPPNELLIDPMKGVSQAGELNYGRSSPCFIRNLAEGGLTGHVWTDEPHLYGEGTGHFAGWARDPEGLLGGSDPKAVYPVFNIKELPTEFCESTDSDDGEPAP